MRFQELRTTSEFQVVVLRVEDDRALLCYYRRMFWFKKIEKVQKVTLYADLFKPNPPPTMGKNMRNGNTTPTA